MDVRSAINQTLTIVGVAIAVFPAAVMTESWTPFFMVMVGVLLVGAGAWRLGTRLLPNRRVYVGLRSEVENFIRLVRRLNAHAMVADTGGVDEIKTEMLASVDRMVSFAGRAD
jgi:hypothetical protein